MRPACIQVVHPTPDKTNATLKTHTAPQPRNTNTADGYNRPAEHKKEISISWYKAENRQGRRLPRFPATRPVHPNRSAQCTLARASAARDECSAARRCSRLATLRNAAACAEGIARSPTAAAAPRGGALHKHSCHRITHPHPHPHHSRPLQPRPASSVSRRGDAQARPACCRGRRPATRHHRHHHHLPGEPRDGDPAAGTRSRSACCSSAVSQPG